MESNKLYRVQEDDLPRLQKLLTVCFAQDPLYHALIPDDDTRERLLPELFSCDLTEFFHTCEIYSDSSELNSILVVSDETEHYNFLEYCLTEAKAMLTTDGWLIKEDLLEFRSGKGLPEFQLDGPASSDRTASCNLPGSGSGPSAPWTGRTSDG